MNDVTRSQTSLKTLPQLADNIALSVSHLRRYPTGLQIDEFSFHHW